MSEQPQGVSFCNSPVSGHNEGALSLSKAVLLGRPFSVPYLFPLFNALILIAFFLVHLLLL